MGRSAEEKICRICRSNEYQNTMISPCKCQGSMKYVHSDCHKEWIWNRPFNLFTPFNFLSCEVCKTVYSVKPTGIMQTFMKIFPNNFK